jgi:hypothetical protein
MGARVHVEYASPQILLGPATLGDVLDSVFANPPLAAAPGRSHNSDAIVLDGDYLERFVLVKGGQCSSLEPADAIPEAKSLPVIQL